MSKHQRSQVVQRIYELMNDGNYEQAASVLYNASRALPDNAEILAAREALRNRHGQEVGRALERGEYHRAVVHVNEYNGRSSKENFDGMGLMIQTSLSINYLKEAELLFKEYRGRKGDDLRKYALGAQVKLKTEAPEEALELARKAVKADPSSYMGHEAEAHALLHLGKLDDALSAIDRSIAVAPDRGVGYLIKTHILLAQGNSQEALDAATIAEKYFPRQAAHYKFKIQSYRNHPKDATLGELKESLLELTNIYGPYSFISGPALESAGKQSVRYGGR